MPYIPHEYKLIAYINIAISDSSICNIIIHIIVWINIILLLLFQQYHLFR